MKENKDKLEIQVLYMSISKLSTLTYAGKSPLEGCQNDGVSRAQDLQE